MEKQDSVGKLPEGQVTPGLQLVKGDFLRYSAKSLSVSKASHQPGDIHQVPPSLGDLHALKVLLWIIYERSEVVTGSWGSRVHCTDGEMALGSTEEETCPRQCPLSIKSVPMI